jgi:transcriptional regulator with XRE-family HTH domain
MNIQNLLGMNVRHLREARGWSQDNLSEESGLHRTYISGIERGVRNPTVGIVEQIAKSLGVSVPALFEDKAIK